MSEEWFDTDTILLPARLGSLQGIHFNHILGEINEFLHLSRYSAIFVVILKVKHFQNFINAGRFLA